MSAAILAGLALGGVYALAASGIVVTYVSAGILNVAFAALAYFVARLYYFLLVQHDWSEALAAPVCLLVVGPVLGFVLWFVLFRHLRLASSLIRLVVVIGLSVCIGPIAILLFGNIPLVNPPGLAPQPVHVFHVLGTVVSMDQIIVYAGVVAVLGAGVVILKFTDIGLKVRAVVDSEALSSISGINPSKVAAAVWAVGTFLAGLCGILIAPIIGLDLSAFTVLVAAAFAAAVAAQLRRVGTAVVVGVLMGIATTLIEWRLPSSSQLTADVIPSIPFIFIIIFLAYFKIRTGRTDDKRAAGVLDAAIAPHGGSELALAQTASVAARSEPLTWRIGIGPVLAVALLVVVPFALHGVWSAMVGFGIAYAVVFLSWILVTGEGGMLWLCQITFAGIGAFMTAELAGMHGWPIIPALIAGGLAAGVVGTILGFFTVHLGDIYVALVTLTFALLAATLVVQTPSLDNFGAGISVSRPSFAQSDPSFGWFALVVFIILAALVMNIRRSTLGLSVVAARWSDQAARMSGVGVVGTKVWLGGAGAFVAGVGGGLLALYANAAIPASYDVTTGLIWLAVLVTVGIRSPGAALFAGLAFAFIPEIFASYLPTSWGNVPPALFGLGAVLVARNPEGTFAMHARQLRGIVSRYQHGEPSIGAVDPKAQRSLAGTEILEKQKSQGNVPIH
jgi:branched-chain amino acid transport system permease protein